MTILVIVESPAKCKKIESYLGSNYKCMASYGHLRTISGLSDIDIDNNYSVTYSIIDEPLKRKQIERIRQEIAKSSEVILATDDDREGEAIAWHICQLFQLSVEKTQRILFREITETALQHAVLSPTTINMNIVHAQQARQVLDMLVGYTISPVLWKLKTPGKSSSSLSAGRCQTPCLRLIYDNYLDIKQAPGKLVYNTTGYFTNLNLSFELTMKYTTHQEVVDFYDKCSTSEFNWTVSQPKKTIKKSPEPLTTSNLQQLASNELHLSPKDTMKYAQQLYEGGYITYMRTDSKKYSAEFVDTVRSHIIATYGETYYNVSLDMGLKESETKTKSTTKTKNKDKDRDQNNIQEAHEAIRPVYIDKRHIEIDGDITAKAIRLYELIWKRTMESCMSSGQFHSITTKINVYDNVDFVYKTEQVIFPGWLIIENKYEQQSTASAYTYLTSLKKGITLTPKKITSMFTLIECKSHYTDANLIKTLEDKGIGRPSTFASLIDKIQERKYVEKKSIEGREIENTNFSYDPNTKQITRDITKKVFGNETNKLVITPLGIIIIEFLLNHFNAFFDYDYTKQMEDELDVIAKGSKLWNILCDECYRHLLVYMKEDFKRFEIEIDDEHKIIISKNGPVIKYTDKKDETNVKFISLKKDVDFKNIAPRSVHLSDIIDAESVHKSAIGKYKGEDLFVKTGKYGVYAQWGKNMRSLKDMDIPMDKITYMELLHFLDKDDILDPKKPMGVIRELTPNMSIRSGKFGDYIFYKKPRTTKPAFYKLEGFSHDYKTCNPDLLVNWITQTYKI